MIKETAISFFVVIDISNEAKKRVKGTERQSRTSLYEEERLFENL
jgi:hypothetical protein